MSIPRSWRANNHQAEKSNKNIGRAKYKQPPYKKKWNFYFPLKIGILDFNAYSWAPRTHGFRDIENVELPADIFVNPLH